MKLVAIATVLGIGLSIASPLFAAQDTKIYVLSSQLDPDAAALNATTDFQRGKCQLYAVASFAWYFPETGDEPFMTKAGYTLIYISDTSDFAAADDTANARGRAYASAYNRVAFKNCGAKQ
jgi:hypothetical protein